jgi:hypothetical protein
VTRDAVKRMTRSAKFTFVTESSTSLRQHEHYLAPQLHCLAISKAQYKFANSASSGGTYNAPAYCRGYLRLEYSVNTKKSGTNAITVQHAAEHTSLRRKARANSAGSYAMALFQPRKAVVAALLYRFIGQP